MTVVNAGLAEIAKLTGAGLTATAFDEIALGDSTTSVTASDTTLGNEISANGTTRKTGGDVTGTTTTTSFTDDTMRFEVTWSITGTVTVNEFGVFNGAMTDVMLLRQVFANPFNLQNQDTFTLTIDVQQTASDDDTGGVLPDQILAETGMAETNKLVVSDLSGTAFTAVGVGNDNGTALSIDSSNTRLGEEFIASGLSRSSATVTAETTTVTDDTTRFEATYNVTDTETVNEVAVFNNATPPSDDGDGDDFTTNSSGIMLTRHIYENPLNLVNGDTFTQRVEVVNTG